MLPGIIPVFNQAAAAYTGPGDLGLGTAVAWWGLRAYSAAKAGTKAVQLRRSGGSSPGTLDFNTLANGSLDLASIISWYNADSSTQMTVATLYDQTGNGIDLTQASTSVQPLFGTTIGPISSKPGMQWGPGALWMGYAPGLTTPQPLTMVAVHNETTGGSQTSLMSDAVSLAAGFHNTVANDAFMYNGTTVVKMAQTSGAWHVFQWVFNDVGSGTFITVDGTQTSGSLGSNVGFTNSGSLWNLGRFNASSGQNVTGFSCEFGIWSVGFDATKMTNMYNNAHLYWGF